jgi:hypothetical protein
MLSPQNGPTRAILANPVKLVFNGGATKKVLDWHGLSDIDIPWNGKQRKQQQQRRRPHHARAGRAMLGMQSEAHCNAHSLLLALASHARAIDIYESYGGRSGGGIWYFDTLPRYQWVLWLLAFRLIFENKISDLLDA